MLKTHRLEAQRLAQAQIAQSHIARLKHWNPIQCVMLYMVVSVLLLWLYL